MHFFSILFFSILIYYSGAGWAAANRPNDQLPLHMKDAEQMEKIQFYGVMKKSMNPPKTLNGGEEKKIILCRLHTEYDFFCADIVANPVFDLYLQFIVPSTRWKPTPLTSYFWTYR